MINDIFAIITILTLLINIGCVLIFLCVLIVHPYFKQRIFWKKVFIYSCAGGLIFAVGDLAYMIRNMHSQPILFVGRYFFNMMIFASAIGMHWDRWFNGLFDDKP